MGSKCCTPVDDDPPIFDPKKQFLHEIEHLDAQVKGAEVVPAISDTHELYVPVNVYSISNESLTHEPCRMAIIGPPGAGKRTQSESLMEQYGVVHLSTGDMLRSAVAAESELGLKAKTKMDAGELVSDEIVIGIVRERIMQQDCQEKGFLLDGFPRTVAQAEALDEMLGEELKLTHIINLQVSNEMLEERVTGRRIHPSSGRSYHVKFNPPKQEGIDNETGEKLILRDDDTSEAFEKRMQKFDVETVPVLDYYKSRGLIAHVDGSTNNRDEVWKRIQKALTPAPDMQGEWMEPEQKEEEDSPSKRVLVELEQRLSIRDKVPLLPYKPNKENIAETSDMSDLAEVLSTTDNLEPPGFVNPKGDPASSRFVISMFDDATSPSVVSPDFFSPSADENSVTDNAWTDYANVPGTASTLVTLLRVVSTSPDLFQNAMIKAHNDTGTEMSPNLVPPHAGGANEPTVLDLGAANSKTAKQAGEDMFSPASNDSCFGRVRFTDLDGHDEHGMPETPMYPSDLEQAASDEEIPEHLKANPMKILRGKTFQIHSETKILINRFQEDHSKLNPDFMTELENSDVIFLLHGRVIENIKSPADVADVLIKIQHSIDLIENLIPQMKTLITNDEDGATHFLTHLVQELLKRASAEGLLKGVQQDWSKWKGADIRDKIIEQDIRQMVQYMAWLKNNIRASASVDYNDAQFAKEASMEIKEVLKSLLNKMKTVDQTSPL